MPIYNSRSVVSNNFGFAVIDWNPDKKSVLYFHLVGSKDKPRNSYLKVDCINQFVVIVHLDQPPERGRGRNGIVGIYKLRWVTWLGGYTHWLKYEVTIYLLNPSNLLKVLNNRTYRKF